MTIEQLGALGEFLGALAVIASVLYLALQIRHGLKSTEGAAVQNVTGLFARMQFEMAANGELSSLIHRAHRGDPLDAVERTRAGNVLSAYLIAFENFHYQDASGLMDGDAFRSRERVIAGVLGSPFARRWWDEWGRPSHPPEFAAAIDRILAEADARSDATPDGC